MTATCDRLQFVRAADDPEITNCDNDAMSLLAKTAKRFPFIAYDTDKGPSLGEIIQNFAIDPDGVLSILDPDGNVTSRVYTKDMRLVIETAKASEIEVWDVQVCDKIGASGSPVFVALARMDKTSGQEVRRESTFGNDYECGVFRVGKPGKETSFRTTFSYLGTPFENEPRTVPTKE